ncbi:MAG: class I SAM-dependent RNA methyltransferase [Marivibrio sp.]|uniref:class I SAM-dependent RNA methyltransferase n=1 Tax=Marivibrio sp. TaxID=2039719 RepID=UPI0032EC3582
MPKSVPRRKKARRPASPTELPPIEVAADYIGAQGDGVVEESEHGRLYVPLAAPGDRLRVVPGAKRGDGRTARIEEILEASPDRTEPPCRHFGICGGCALQHVAPTAIAREKRDLLIEALARKGFDEAALEERVVSETVSIPPGTRRRARLAVRRIKGRAILGFNERAGPKVVDLQHCPILVPALVEMLPALRELAGGLKSLGEGGDVHLLASETGADVLFLPAKAADPGLAEREALTAFAERFDVARIAWAPEPGAPPEPVTARRAPRVTFGGAPIEPPPAAFLQPSREGERAIAGAVAAALADADRIADLYAGCGSLGLPLAAAGKAVHAVEGLADHVDAFRKAGGALGLRVSAEVRDLARSPLTADELQRFDAVLFDPPRAGAAEQAREIAASAVARVVAVSCNPSTLARDLRTLEDGGYRLQAATPIDQFPWSGHLEAVAVLSRA